MAEDGTSSLVPPELLGSVPELFTDEPALGDSLLNVDDNLTSLELSEQTSLELSEQTSLELSEQETKGVLCVLTRDDPYSAKRNETKTKNYCRKQVYLYSGGTCFERYHTVVRY